MLELVRNFKQDFLALPEEFQVRPGSSARRAIVCGMGGSGITGLVLRDALGDSLRAPIEVTRDYSLPKDASPKDLVVCITYSGNTEETFSCLAAAEAKGCEIIGIASGGRVIEECKAKGLQYVKLRQGIPPRTALPVLLSGLVRALAAKGVLAKPVNDVESIVEKIDVADCEERAGKLAAELRGFIPWIYAYGFEGVANRAKTQFNENSKLPSAYQMFPELNHNDVVGWGTDARKAFKIIFIDDPAAPERIRKRIAVTKDLLRDRVAATSVEMRGATPLEKVISTILVFDMASIILALNSGVDPVEVRIIERLKAALDEKNYKP
jgi:glucose/mannose-6-phosphate isomerase